MDMGWISKIVAPQLTIYRGNPFKTKELYISTGFPLLQNSGGCSIGEKRPKFVGIQNLKAKNSIQNRTAMEAKNPLNSNQKSSSQST